ncbi:hypothetical protein Tco_0682957 [Tanacetum coccineum]|uniref:Uncharacterized protein n=1 Tax=Tanacetum coccineum TaxID=301880 RepID=A0ABQ4XTS2_9ASTR
MKFVTSLVLLATQRHIQEEVVISHVSFDKAWQYSGTDDLDMMAVNAAVLKAMELIHSENASPAALPGFGRSPMVRQLRVTDSPFPLCSVDEDCYVVDEADISSSVTATFKHFDSTIDANLLTENTASSSSSQFHVSLPFKVSLT